MQTSFFRNVLLAETFDDVVRENIEDFGLDSVEALKDAISQFNKQGVSLSNIDISGGIGRDDALRNISDLMTAITAHISGSENDLLNCLSAAREICSKVEELYLRNINLFKDKGAINSLHLLLESNQNSILLLPTMLFLKELSSNSGRFYTSLSVIILLNVISVITRGNS